METLLRSIALAGVLSFGTAAAAPSALDRADAHLAADEFAQAGDAFVEYYDALPPAMQTDATGEFVVMNAAGAYDRDWQAQQSQSSLTRSQAVLARFIAAVEAEHGSTSSQLERPRAELERVEALLAAAEEPATPDPAVVPPGDEPEPQPNAPADPGPKPATVTDIATPTTPRDKPPRRKDPLGLGLVIGGAVTFVGGGAMIGWGSAYERLARERLPADSEFSEEDERDYLDKAHDGRIALLAGGSAVAAVGVAAIVWGAVRLARGRKASTARIYGGPAIGPAGAGLTFAGRF